MSTSSLLFKNIQLVLDSNLTSTLQSNVEKQRFSTVNNIISNASSGAGVGNIPTTSCGGASASTVDNIYPKSAAWYGKNPVLVPIQNPPTYKVILSKQPLVGYIETIVTPEEYIRAADKVINQLSPNVSVDNRRKIVTSAFAISRQEQGGPNGGFRGFNNNISGIESSGFSVFVASDVVGKTIRPERYTGKRKEYYAFSSLSSGLIPLISSIMKRNMFPTGGTPEEFAWRYYRDWNGYGARVVNPNDCINIEGFAKNYISAKKIVDRII